jgi:flavin-dependent dehydrogenase
LLRAAALDAGAVDVAARVASVDGCRVVLDAGGSIEGDFVVGADGATSITARTVGLVDASRALWGFAVRGYIEAEVTLPVIALWNDQPRRGFPGYGWLFPGPDGSNLGLGLGLGHTRQHGHRAQQQLDQFRSHLVRIGVLDSQSGSALRQLGGWLKLGVVGTRPAAGKVLLVGDAAGLVNPLQGEGISQALESGRAAASAILHQPGDAADGYRRWVRETYGRWTSVTAPVHAAMVRRPRYIAALSAALTAPVVGRSIASTWAIYWNNLGDGALPTPAAKAAQVVHRLGRVGTMPSRLRRSLNVDLGDHAWR